MAVLAAIAAASCHRQRPALALGVGVATGAGTYGVCLLTLMRHDLSQLLGLVSGAFRPNARRRN
jgi:hypothetical protein